MPPARTDQIIQAVVKATEALPVTFTTKSDDHSGALQVQVSDATSNSHLTRPPPEVPARARHQLKRRHQELDADGGINIHDSSARAEELKAEEDFTAQFPIRLGRHGRAPNRDFYRPSSTTASATEPIICIIVITLVRRELVIPVKRSFTISHLKDIIHEMGEQPPDEQRLIFRGKQLEDHLTLADVSHTMTFSDYANVEFSVIPIMAMHFISSCGSVDRRPGSDVFELYTLRAPN